MSDLVFKYNEMSWQGTEDAKEKICIATDSPVFSTMQGSGGWYELSAGLTGARDTHEVDEIYFVTSGNGIVFLDGVEHRLESRTTILVPKGTDHYFVNDRTDPLVVIFFFSPGIGISDGWGMTTQLTDTQ